MKNLLVFVFLFVAIPVTAGEKAPLPTKLINAKTAFVINDGTWSKAYDKFYAELKKWNRFELVEEKEQADIVIVLSTNPGSLGGGLTSNPSGVGVMMGGSESKFYIRITDAEDGTPLWADSTGEALLVSNSAKKFVSRLRKRFIGVVSTTPQKRAVGHANPQESVLKADGNELLRDCTQAVRTQDGEKLDDLQLMDASYCFGYIGGFVDAHAWVSVAPGNRPTFCLPKGGLQPRQGARIVVKWLNDHPEELHHEDGMVTLLALMEAFPCNIKEPTD